MADTLTALEFRERLAMVLRQVSIGHDHVVIVRHGQPVAVLVPVEAWRAFEAMQAASARAQLALTPPGGLPANEDDSDAADEPQKKAG